MKTNVIIHIYNEESMLPHWLEHHRGMFDHGVIIDYHSTDGSLDIARRMVPHWEIRTTRNEFFEEPAVGDEVEDIEETLQGWKITLNVTEFLLMDDLHQYCRQLEERNISAVHANGVVMVDPGDHKLMGSWGYFEEDVVVRPSITGRPIRLRSRLLHRHPRGLYGLGRHSTNHTAVADHNFFLCWHGWCPFNEATLSRKLQIQTKVSDQQKTDSVWAATYVVNREQMIANYHRELCRSYDLEQLPGYRRAIEIFRGEEGSIAALSSFVTNGRLTSFRKIGINTC